MDKKEKWLITEKIDGKCLYELNLPDKNYMWFCYDSHMMSVVSYDDLKDASLEYDALTQKDLDKILLLKPGETYHASSMDLYICIK